MARPEKNNVEYFPFLCKEGKAMFYIENKYGNDGYATWVKILRQLAVTNNHWINLSDAVELMYLASKCRVSEQVLCNIIQDLCTLGEFNSFLWNENKVIFSEKFIHNIQDAYKKRSNECIGIDDLLLLLSDLGIRKLDKSTIKGPDNPHTIIDNTILNNIIVENKINIEFDFFWNEYDKKVGSKEKLKKKWEKLSDKEREQALNYLPKYKESQPNKQYRKNLETFLNNKSWNDEIITRTNGQQTGNTNERKESVRNLKNLSENILDNFSAQNGG